MANTTLPLNARERALQANYREKAATQQASLAPALARTITGVMPQLPSLLPPDISVEQFRAALFLELSGRQQLAQCTDTSLRDAVIKAGINGMLPGRDCHLLPFKNKGRLEAVFVPNYFGILLTLERTGKVRKAFAQAVHEHDAFTFDFFADTYSHVPAMLQGKEPGKLLFYYGAVQTTDGVYHVEPMELSEIEGIKRRAPAHDSGPWQTDFDQMARKTALKRCCKFVRLTQQQQEMLAEDDARELLDIPPERHAKNIADVFDNAPIDLSPETPPAAPTQTVHQPFVSTMWREVLETHAAQLPEPLRSEVRAVLEGQHTVSDSEGHALVDRVYRAIAREEFFPDEDGDA